MSAKKSTAFLTILSFILIFNFGASAQQREIKTEERRISGIVSVWLPSDAEKILPETVPAGIKAQLDQIIEEAGGGKFKQYDTEVLIWRGESFKKRGADAILKLLIGNLERSGWRVAQGKPMDGLIVLGAENESIPKSVIGFYIITEDGLLLAWSQVYTD